MTSRSGRTSDRLNRERTALFVSVACLVAALVVLAVTATGGSRRSAATASTTGGASAATKTTTTQRGSRPAEPPSSFAVGLRVIRFVDRSRMIRMPDGAMVPRTLLTYIRYPAIGPIGRGDVRNAPAASAFGPYPLIVFAHGFNITPAPYDRLLQRWAQAGYVVAAPVFPLENANAPGGPNETDLINQPRDMSYVITRAISVGGPSSPGPLHGMVDPRRIAVTGQSDGGDTALTVTYNEHFVDHRIGAAMILSGAEIPGAQGYDFPVGSPPLLAIQGTADTVNLPSETDAYFERARPPRYLLRLLGSEHLPPYTEEQPQLEIVERATLAFLDAYLNHRMGGVRRFLAVAKVPGVTSIVSRP